MKTLGVHPPCMLIVLLSVVLCCGTCDRILQNRKEHYYEQGMSLFKQRKYGAAIKEFDKALAFDPKYYDALAMMGKSYYEQGRYVSASTWFGKAISEKPDAVEVRYLQASSLYFAGKYGQSLKAAENLLAIDPDNNDAVLLRLKTRVKTRLAKQVEESREEIKDLISRGNDDPVLRWLLAEVLVLKGAVYLDEAEELLMSTRADDPEWIASMEFLAEGFRSETLYSREIKVYRGIIETVQNKLPYQLMLGELLRNRNKKEEEELLWRQMVEQYPDNIQIQLKLINYYIQHDEVSKGEELLLAAIDKNPENYNLRKEIVQLHEERGDYAKAVEMAMRMLEELKRGSNQSIEMANKAAELYFKQGNIPRARMAAKAVLKMSPRDVDAKFVLHKIDLKEGKILKAIGGLRQLSLKNPNAPEIFYYLGLAHEQRGEMIMAEKAFSDALDADPGHKESLRKISKIYRQKNFLNELVERIKKYLEVKPKDTEILSLLNEVYNQKQ